MIPLNFINRSSNLIDPSLLNNFPFNYDAEKGLLSAFFLDNCIFDEINGRLKPIDFYDSKHRLIFESMLRLRERLLPIDMATIQEDLFSQGVFSDIGGRDFLLSFQGDISSLGLVENYVFILKEKSNLRQIINSATRLISRCYDKNGIDIQNIVDDAEKMLFDIAHSRNTNSFVQLDICLKKTFDELVSVKSIFKGITGIPTGFNSLDELTGGFQNGDLIILAARPSMGKTALSLKFLTAASSYSFPVGFISLEMGADQISLRLLSFGARVRLASLRSAQLSAEDWNSITTTAAKLARQKIFIDDAPSQTVAEIRTKCRKLKLEHGIKFLIIDYLQLISPIRKHESRQQEVSEISRSLKMLAKELNIPILALSQLSRGVESRIDKRPLLSDLRDSGAIEQDADLIMFLYRDHVYNPSEPDNIAELIIGKQRNGPTGNCKINYAKEFAFFYE
jgi:replicative DNA helicase